MMVPDHGLATRQRIDDRVDAVVEQPPHSFGVLRRRIREAELVEKTVRDKVRRTIEVAFLPRGLHLPRIGSQAADVSYVQVVLGRAVERQSAPSGKDCG